MKLFLVRDFRIVGEREKRRKPKSWIGIYLPYEKQSFIKVDTVSKIQRKKNWRILNFFEEKTEEKRDSEKNYGNCSAALVHIERYIFLNTTIRGMMKIS